MDGVDLKSGYRTFVAGHRKGKIAMRNRYWFTTCYLPMAIAVVAVGLMVWNTPIRELLNPDMDVQASDLNNNRVE